MSYFLLFCLSHKALLHGECVLRLRSGGFADECRCVAAHSGFLRDRREIRTVYRIRERQMAHLALIVILDMREVGVQLGSTLVTDGIFHQVEQRFHFLTGIHVPARAAVEMTEVDARQQAVIGSHQLADLLGSAEHALFAMVSRQTAQPVR